MAKYSTNRFNSLYPRVPFHLPTVFNVINIGEAKGLYKETRIARSWNNVWRVHIGDSQLLEDEQAATFRGSGIPKSKLTLTRERRVRHEELALVFVIWQAEFVARGGYGKIEAKGLSSEVGSVKVGGKFYCSVDNWRVTSLDETYRDDGSCDDVRMSNFESFWLELIFVGYCSSSSEKYPRENETVELFLIDE